MRARHSSAQSIKNFDTCAALKVNMESSDLGVYFGQNNEWNDFENSY